MESIFLKAIIDNPSDDLHRRAYADWLMEQPDGAKREKGELIHLSFTHDGPCTHHDDRYDGKGYRHILTPTVRRGDVVISPSGTFIVQTVLRRCYRKLWAIACEKTDRAPPEKSIFDVLAYRRLKRKFTLQIGDLLGWVWEKGFYSSVRLGIEKLPRWKKYLSTQPIVKVELTNDRVPIFCDNQWYFVNQNGRNRGRPHELCSLLHDHLPITGYTRHGKYRYPLRCYETREALYDALSEAVLKYIRS